MQELGTDLVLVYGQPIPWGDESILLDDLSLLAGTALATPGALRIGYKKRWPGAGVRTQQLELWNLVRKIDH